MHRIAVPTTVLCVYMAQLDVLAGRKSQGKVDGTILFGNQKPTHAFLKRYTGYGGCSGYCCEVLAQQ